MSEKTVKRDFPRVTKLLFTGMSSFDEKGEGAMLSLGRTLNISEGGMLLEVSKNMPFQLKVNLRLGFQEEIIEMEGNVVHLRKTDAGDIEIGIEFINPTKDQLEIISQAMVTSLGQGFS
ncbi:MAG TPA: PilZ domain-containing protein [Nitrospirae bacterium]|nr:PilZ domain-containing protein [Nitrospirota bacterium]